MANTIQFYRSSTTAIVAGTTALASGKPAMTDIGGLKRFYLGDMSGIAQEIGGAAYALLASPTFTGTPAAPTAASGTSTTQLATTAFVAAAVTASAAGLSVKNAVVAESTSALPAYTYANGAAGVGATITANANGAFPTLGGATVTVGDRFLLKDGAAASDNGIYTLTVQGSAGTAWVGTRAVDFNSASNITANSFVFSQDDETQWVLNISGTVTVGTTALPFVQFGAGTTYTAGAGIDLTASAFSIQTGGVTNAMLAGSIADSNLSTISTANKVAGSAVQIKTGAALSDSTGLQVVVDGTSLVNTAGTLAVGTVDGGTF